MSEAQQYQNLRRLLKKEIKTCQRLLSRAQFHRSLTDNPRQMESYRRIEYRHRFWISIATRLLNQSKVESPDNV